MRKIASEEKRKAIMDYYYRGGYGKAYRLINIVSLVSPHYPLDEQQQDAFQFLIKWNEDESVITKMKQSVEIPSDIRHFLHSLATCMEKNHNFPLQQIPQYDMNPLFEGMKECGTRAAIAYNERLKNTEHFSKCVRQLELYVSGVLTIEEI